MEYQRFWKTRQAWCYRFLTKIEGYSVKISIKRDSYDDQSFARADVWSDAELKWNLAATIPYPDMQTLYLSYTADNGDDYHWWEWDEEALLEEVRWILTGKEE
jgi:hypothetical protein